ncbi:NACHT domain-containing protein [Kocuria sediminis]|uniref:NACHT domain-containing protein n=1 Tax=Kocuria sediminis TaxID=1038857 RepID=UPI00197FD2F7
MVTEAITMWARSERFTDEELELGLTLATVTVAQFGLSNEVLAELRFDPRQAANKVMASARKKDRYWGTEKHYEVAARSIAVTYEALIKQLQANHDVLIPVFQALRDRIDAHAAAAQDMAGIIHLQLSDLVESLVAPSTVSEVMSYLRTRIADWNVSVWHHDRQAAALERHLRVREQANPATGGDYLTAEEALAHQQMLVVLGGPGAGKTWLARRYARQAAQTALSQLEDGAGLDEVELPLLTTWEQWVKAQSGSPRESLVEASFASSLGHSDPGDGDIAGRLRRAFLRPQARVLLVVDSLDEAADQTAQAPRLHVLRGLPGGWRVVVTSRPAAWDATYRGDSVSASTPRVVTLCDLTYPDDVQTFIRDWFVEAADPTRGEALIREIRGRAELARVAVVPLMLTFYCLLAEDPKAGAEPLPARRRKLYDRLARRLLLGRWTADHPGLDAAPDWGYCEELLRNWAWQAVCDRTNDVELGVWEDSFTPSTTVRKAERRAIDHMVPKTAADGEGNITRRFVHRTFLEHFVAEHIATLDASEAAGLLLPHLWFDPDWKVAAPAAIVAHNQQQQGTLFQHLLDRVAQPAPDPARQEARNQIDQLLLAIAQESEADEWSPEHQNVLHECRTSNAIRAPDLVTRSAHWTRSNPDARTMVLQAVPTADPWGVADLVEVLVGLGITQEERAQARSVVLQALPTTDLWGALRLVEVLVGLGPIEEERAQARKVVLQVLPTAEPGGVADLVGVLVELRPIEEERTQASTVVLQALPNAEPWAIADLVKALVGLGITEEELAEERRVVLQALTTAEPWVVLRLVEVLMGLGPIEEEQAQARSVMLQALPTAQPGVVVELLKMLVGRGLTEEERAQARSAVLQVLPTANPWGVADLVEVLVGWLGITEEERAQARGVVLQVLPIAAGGLERLGEVLVGLGPTEEEQAQARSVVLQVLPTSEPGGVAGLVGVLVGLGITEEEQAQARSVVLQVLPTAEPWAIADLVKALVGLVITEEERAQARSVVLQVLPTAEPWVIGRLVEFLVELGITDEERAQARSVVLQVLPTAEPGGIVDLVKALVGLVITQEERAQARSVVLQVLPTAEPGDIPTLVGALRAVSSVESWLMWLSGGQASK